MKRRTSSAKKSQRSASAVAAIRSALREEDAVEQNKAITDILRVISSSPGDLQKVFDAILSNAMRLCDATFAAVFRYDGAIVELAAANVPAPSLDILRRDYPAPPNRGKVSGRVVLERKIVEIPDILADAKYKGSAPQAGGYRALLGVPLLREGRAIGVINIARTLPGKFTPRQVATVQTFAEQAVIAIENARLFNEAKQALERQTGTAEILKVIASSPSDVQPVFDAIAASALRIFGGFSTAVFRVADDIVHLAAMTATADSGDEVLRSMFPRPLGEAPGNAAIAMRKKSPNWIGDTEADPPVPAEIRKVGRARGWRSTLAVPMMRGPDVIGAINVTRRAPGPFSEHQVALLKTFADQAVIAIENARLFNETKDALERQTATADILKVIASSPLDVQPVFDTIVASSKRLLAGRTATLARVVDDQVHLTAFTSTSPEADEELGRFYPRPLTAGYAISRAARERRPILVSDTETDPNVSPETRELARRRGYRSALTVPMLRGEHLIGVLAVTRELPGPFSPKEVALLQTFADQAVIAIENARLFNETKEALERQTATAEILKVISSSPTNVQPVFQAVAERAAQLCNAANASVLISENGSALRRVATFGHSIADPARPARRTWINGRAFVERRTIHVEDVVAALDEYPETRENQQKLGFRTMVAVPMMREGTAIGTIGVWRRELKPFSTTHLELLETFAAQAVIAIENVRLFNETKDALERQTATANILGVIAQSPTDIQPVLDTIAERAATLCQASVGAVVRYDGALIHLAALKNVDPRVGEAMVRAFPMPPGHGVGVARAVLTKQAVHIPDVLVEPDYVIKDASSATGFRSVFAVPMLRGDAVIGAIAVGRPQAGPFDERHMALLRTFADQAVIAIENVRLFNQTREALERQTATAEILKVIAGSPTEVQPVFDAIAQAANRLVGGFSVAVLRIVDGHLHLAAHTATGNTGDEMLRHFFPRPLSAFGKGIGTAIRSGVPQATEDFQNDPEVPAETREVARARGFRGSLAVPMLRGEEVLGVINVTRHEAGRFSDHQIELLKTFADQAVIAIENVRLFNETKEALERQTATAEILRVISSTPTDTRPVFDAIVTNAQRIISAKSAILLLRRETDLFVAAYSIPGLEELPPEVRTVPLDPAKNFPSQVMLEGKVLHIPDWEADNVMEFERFVAKAYGIGSGVQVPLLRQGEGIGALVVTRATKGSFSQKEIALLQSFADQAVIAMENVRLFNETKESLEQQTAIGEVLRVISASPTDVKPVLDAVATRAARICDASDARLFLLEGEELRNTAAVGDMPSTTRIGDTFPLDHSTVTGAAVVERAVIHVEDFHVLPEGMYGVTRDRALRHGYRTMLSVPLMREQRPLGAISLRRMAPRPFTEKQIALVKTFADQAAIAIENVRLFNKTQEALEQQTATAEVLSVISGSITDARPVFQAISRAVLRLYGARHVGLYVRSADRIERVGYALADKSADDGSHTLWPIPLDDKSLTGRTILRGELVHIKDLQTEGGLSDVSREIHRLTEVRSVLLAPMQSMGVTLGALSVARRSPGGFSERELELIRTFADQGVIAMENVRLFREIEEKSRQLETASKHKSHFLASMSHELRTPLNAILGFNEMILDGIYGELTPDVRAPLENIQSSGKHLLRLINNVLDLAKIEAGRMELALSEFSVQDTVASVHSTLKPLAAEKGIQFVAEVPADIPLARGDSGRIAQCLMNLAGNSLKFTKEGRVSIAVAQDNGLLRFSVADTGIGIPAEKIAHLFTEFKQTDATIASEYGGTGLGLSITKKFIEMHGGRIWVESEPGKGSNFQFEIPLRAAQ